jgi:methionyl-tRNA formyltransferase
MNKKKIKVLLLTGSSGHHAYTLKLLVESKVETVGVCVADNKIAGGNLGYAKSVIKKESWNKLFGQVLLKVIYRLFNGIRDKKIIDNLLPERSIYEIIDDNNIEYIETESYQKERCFNWIKSKEPDLILVHSPYWVGKKIRDYVQGRVLGGHPGITPYYRGVHSAFWAVYNREYSKIGYSVFWLDEGVDTGDVLLQGQIFPDNEKNDSFVTLSVKAMKRTSETQIQILNAMVDNQSFLSYKHDVIKTGTLYQYPTLWDYMVYRVKQKLVR